MNFSVFYFFATFALLLAFANVIALAVGLWQNIQNERNSHANRTKRSQ